MISCALWIALSPICAMNRQGDILDRVINEYSVSNVPVREALEKLSKISPFRYWIQPDLDGKVTFACKGKKFELVLQGILVQANLTYRYEYGRFVLVPRTPMIGDPGYVEFPRIKPAGYTSRYTFTNNRLFLTPKKSILGTVELLKEAVYRKEFYDFQFWAYGKEGFAMLLPFEEIDTKGNPTPKEFPQHFSMPYLKTFGFENLTKLFTQHYRAEGHDYRAILLTVDVEPLNEAVGNHSKPREGYTGGTLDLSYEQWSKEPEINAFVYEFRRKPDQLVGELIKEGGSKISAKQHLLLSGLWTEEELDGGK